MPLPEAYVISDQEALLYGVPLKGRTDLVQECVRGIRLMLEKPALWIGNSDYEQLLPLLENELGLLSSCCNAIPRSHFSAGKQLGATGLRRLLTVWPQENPEKTRKVQKDNLVAYVEEYLSWIPNHLLAWPAEQLEVTGYTLLDKECPANYYEVLRNKMKEIRDDLHDRMLVAGPLWSSTVCGQNAFIELYTLKQPLALGEKLWNLRTIAEEAIEPVRTIATELNYEQI